MQCNFSLTRTLNADTLDPNTLLQPYFIKEAPFQNPLKLNNAHELNLVRRVTVDFIKFYIHLKNEHMTYLNRPLKYLKGITRPRLRNLWLRANKNEKHAHCCLKDQGRPW